MARPKYTREGRVILVNGRRALFCERELDATGDNPLTPRQSDLLVERIVRLLNGGK